MLDLRVEDMVLNPAYFREITDFATAILTTNQDAPFQIKINPLVRSIGFLESLHFMQDLYVNGEVYQDYRRNKEVKKQYTKALTHFLDDFKAQTRQYAKRQNIWYRKECDFVWMDVMGGDSGPKRIHAVINRLVDCLKLNRNNLKDYLNADEQAKVRAVNTEPEANKVLK